MNKAFASGGGKLAAALEKHVPARMEAFIDERYGDEPDMFLDVFRPASASAPLPLLMWVHGGGFIGGTKDELAGYFKVIASDGYVVVGTNYSLAPKHHYPTPPRQMMQASSTCRRTPSAYRSTRTGSRSQATPPARTSPPR